MNYILLGCPHQPWVGSDQGSWGNKWMKLFNSCSEIWNWNNYGTKTIKKLSKSRCLKQLSILGMRFELDEYNLSQLNTNKLMMFDLYFPTIKNWDV